MVLPYQHLPRRLIRACLHRQLARLELAFTPTTKSCLAALAISLVLAPLSACTVVRHRLDPQLKAAQTYTTNAGMVYGGGNGLSVNYFLGVTFSKSISSVSGTGSQSFPGVTERQTLIYSREKPLVLNIFASSSACGLGAVDTEYFQRSMQRVFEPANSVIPVGHIEVTFLPVDATLARQTYAVRFGRNIQLNFFFTCAETDNSEQEVFAALLDVMHETAHAIMRINNVDIPVEDEEKIADGASACVYASLQVEGAQRLLKKVTYSKYFASHPLHPTEDAADMAASCGLWYQTVAKIAKR